MIILEGPGAASRDDAIFSDESFHNLFFWPVVQNTVVKVASRAAEGFFALRNVS